MRKRFTVLAIVAIPLVLLLIMSCGAGKPAGDRAASSPKGRVIVAGKNFGEGYVLGWMAALLIRDSTQLAVDDGKIGMGATELLYPALKQGSIDVYADYAGTLRTTVLKVTAVEHDRQKIWDATVAGIKARDGVESVGPLGFNNTFAISMKGETAKKLGITKLSDLARHPELRLIGDATTWTRPDAYAGMAAYYGISLKKGAMVDTNFFYEALEQGEGEVITAFSTDGKLKKYGLTVLQDDRSYYPWYDAIFLVNGATASKHPELVMALAKLKGRLDENTMIGLNEKVDVEKQEPEAVARNWLKAQGLISH
jgi:glycine betaine/choline ABC-type transport system substrate-binding protein